MIYLASPYSHPEESERTRRYDLTVTAMALFLKREEKIYSPIVHCHVAAMRFDLPLDYEFWLKYNTHFLERCDSLYVLCIDGWLDSKGV